MQMRVINVMLFVATFAVPYCLFNKGYDKVGLIVFVSAFAIHLIWKGVGYVFKKVQ